MSHESPLKVKRATKERVTLTPEQMFGGQAGEYIERIPEPTPLRELVELAREALRNGSDEAMLRFLRGDE